MSDIVKVKGIRLPLGGRDWVVPPLNLAALEQLQDRLARFSGGLDADSVALVLDATTAALRRNYPDITREQVADMLDVANMATVMEAVMDVSGLKRQAQEATPPGEA